MAGIKEWAEDDRPREKLQTKGAAALSHSELLAILINNGTPDRSALDLAKELLQKNNNDLQKLGRLSVDEMVNLKVKGLGPAKAVTIVAALELGVRRDADLKKKNIISSSTDMAEFLKVTLQHKNYEVFLVVYLNASNRILTYETVSEGGLTATIVDNRVVIRRALELKATAIILSHNHPSGGLKPSKADIDMTQRIKDAAKLFDIRVNDHIIVSNEGYYSFAEAGIL